MSEILHRLSYYIELLSLEKGRKVWYYNEHHSRYEEWWYFDAEQNKFAFYNKRGSQVAFTLEMLNKCARTKDECKLLVFKQREKHINKQITRNQELIRRNQEELQEYNKKILEQKNRLQAEQREFADIIKKYPEEFI